MSPILFTMLVAVLAQVEAQSCRGPGFRINGCNLSLPVRDDNRCGIATDGSPCRYAYCCGENGQCGRTPYHCGSYDLPPLGPPRDDNRCGDAAYEYAGCEPDKICIDTFCLPAQFGEHLKKTGWIPPNTGDIAPQAAPQAEASNAEPQVQGEATPQPIPAPACPNPGTCPPSAPAKAGNGSNGKVVNDVVEISETVEEKEGYVKNSAALTHLLLAIPTFLLLLQIWA